MTCVSWKMLIRKSVAKREILEVIQKFNIQLNNLTQVKDSGCGVVPQDIPVLFTKFAQSRNESGGINGGARLGLAICKRFVNLMGGHIWIESEGLEKGSTATFLIKLGIYINANDSAIHQAPFHVRAFHGSADLQKPLLRDHAHRGSSSNPSARYQRSL